MDLQKFGGRGGRSGGGGGGARQTATAEQGITASQRTALNNAFGQLPEGYRNSAESTQQNHYRLELSNAESRLRYAEENYRNAQNAYESGRMRGMMSERAQLSMLRTMMQEIDQLRDRVNKMRSAYNNAFGG